RLHRALPRAFLARGDSRPRAGVARGRPRTYLRIFTVSFFFDDRSPASSAAVAVADMTALTFVRVLALPSALASWSRSFLDSLNVTVVLLPFFTLTLRLVSLT